MNIFHILMTGSEVLALDYQISNENIGKRVAFLRKNKGLTQAKLGDLVGVTDKHISEIERGVTGISIDMQILLCDVLNCSMDYLIRGKDFATVDFLLPDRILEIFKSNNTHEIALLLDFLEVYQRIHEFPE